MLYLERYALLRLGSLTDVGLFGVAARVATFVTLVSMAIDIAWTPFAMSIQRDPDAPAVYARALSWYLLLAGAAGTVLAVFAREALAVLTTPAYYGAAVIVGPVVAALVLRGASNIVSIGAMVTGRTRAVSGAALVSSAFQAACLLALVPLLGAVGAALATMGARLLAVVVLHLRTRRDYPVPYAWGRIAWMGAVFAAAVLAAQAASQLGLWPGVAVKAGVILPATAVALLATGALPLDEARALLAMVRSRLSRARGAAAPAP